MGLKIIGDKDFDRPVYILKPKLKKDQTLYAINSEADQCLRLNETVVIDINQNSVLKLMPWNEGLKYIDSQKSQEIYKIPQTVPAENWLNF